MSSTFPPSQPPLGACRFPWTRVGFLARLGRPFCGGLPQWRDCVPMIVMTFKMVRAGGCLVADLCESLAPLRCCFHTTSVPLMENPSLPFPRPVHNTLPPLSDDTSLVNHADPPCFPALPPTLGSSFFLPPQTCPPPWWFLRWKTSLFFFPSPPQTRHLFQMPTPMG